MYKRLAHIGIAVKNLDEATIVFSQLFDLPPSHEEVVAEQKVSVRFFQIGTSGIELLEATSPDSPVAKFIEKRGQGVHHLSFEVEDIEAEIARLRQAGFEMVDEKPREGAEGYLVAFLHPKSTNGVLIEISQRTSPA
ncbi:MAG: methylmalonyl-CoA epimerase [Ignavibacteria bacterium]